MTPGSGSDEVRVTKQRCRDDLLARRRAMTPADRDEAALALAAHAAAEPSLSRARRVALYLSMATEPPTAPLIDGFRSRGATVLVPVVVADHQLAWVEIGPGSSSAVSTFGIPEPDGEQLPAEAIVDCDLVLVPALAVDHHGHRLGRGAGYYDRALTLATAPTCAVVFTHELLPDVPHEPHDVAVDLALTPGGLFRVP